MITTKKINVGDYTIIIKHDSKTNSLFVNVYDELGDVIETLEINDVDEEDEDNPFSGIL